MQMLLSQLVTLDEADQPCLWVQELPLVLFKCDVQVLERIVLLDLR